MSNSAIAVRDSISTFFEGETSAELTPFDRLFLVYLRLFDGVIDDTYDMLRRRLNVCSQTIRKSIQRLERLGYVTVTYRRGHSNLIELAQRNTEKN
jgi:DNA-binding MarR family transcriptional regulator